MKLYYAPEACSLADHIALLEVGAVFETERVDIRSKTTASGRDFREVTPKGYVPALVLDGEVITENVALLDLIAVKHPQLGVDGPLGRTRLLEALVYISTEVHKAFKPMWHHGSEAELAAARRTIEGQFGFLAGSARGDFLFGDRPTVADFYLYVMLRWAARFGVPTPRPLLDLVERMEVRPAVRSALLAEGLSPVGSMQDLAATA